MVTVESTATTPNERPATVSWLPGRRRPPSRTVVDVTLGYRLPDQGLTFTGTVANLLDDRTPDLLGAPIPRRFAWLQVAYDLDGLRY